MFVANMLLPGPLAPMAGLACCSAAVGACYAFRKKIPHPAECPLIGQCCLLCRCHNHTKFELLISAHEAENLPKGAKVYLYVEAGRFDVQSQDVRADEKTSKGEFHERMQLHVRQMDNVVKFVLYKRLTLSSEIIGELYVDVLKDLIEEDFPINKWYVFKKEGKNTSKIQLSFHKIESGSGDEMSPLLQQAMIQAQYEAVAKGETAPAVNWGQMEPHDRLVLLAKALEGPLKMMKGMGVKSWKEYHFRASELRQGDWEWSYWKDKAACYKGEKRLGVFPMLAISNVHADPSNRHQFYVKAHDSKGAHDYMFLRVDRDRDVWSDGLYEFIDRLRDYNDKYPPQSKAEAFVAASGKKTQLKKKKAKQQLGARKPSFSVDPTTKRVNVSPRPTGRKPPQSVMGMAMELYEEEEGDDEIDDDEESVLEEEEDTTADGGGGA